MSAWRSVRRALAVAAAVGFCGIVPFRAHAASITLGTLLDEMIDRERLTRLPENPYRLLHASSYDRRALVPNTPAWFANTDWSSYVRVETVDGRQEYVLLDTGGPGALVRFWVTGLGSADTLRIYLDGSVTPVVKGPLKEIVGRGGWAEAPLSFLAPFSTDTGTGHNLYLPVPFRQQCKVTVSTPSSRLYYNIDYRVYDPGADVESCATNGLSLCQADYDRVLSTLAAGHPSPHATSACSRLEGRLSWGGGSRSVALAGPAAVRLLRFRLAASDLPQALRSTHVEIDFDGEKKAVSCPIGDFFGTGCSVTTGCTWFVESAADGTLCAYWTMPFRERATLRVVNHGQQPVDLLQGEVWSGSYAWDEARSMHFHAAWRDYAFEDSIAWSAVKGGEDLNYVTLQGQGRLVGDTLSVFNDASDIPDSYRNWWGEGDEKITVDGEAFPSHFGTGTEDYYGYAWCLPQTFNTPFIAQPTGAGNDRRGMTLNSRVRLLDDIPYASGLRFDMEFLAWRTGRHRFAPTVYWYARPGGRHFTPDPLAKSLLPVPRGTSGAEAASVFCPLGVRVESESMPVAQCSGGSVSCVTSNGFGLSADQCLYWRDCGVGDRLELNVGAAFTGRCDLAVRVLAAPSAGSLRVSVNGDVATNGVSLFAPAPSPLMLPLGIYTISAGTNTLTFEVVGVPPGTNRTGFAFDYLQNEGPYYVSRALPVVRERREGEQLSACVSGGAYAAWSPTNALSAGACALWSGGAVGGSLAFDLVSDTPRQVALTGVFVGTTNGAVCDIRVNGEVAAQGLNLYRSSLEVTRVDLGEHLLQAGTNAVSVVIVGCANGLDTQNLSVGLDCFDIGSLYAKVAERSMETPLIGPREDPDGDGMINLAEYAFGGDPARSDGPDLWPAPWVMRQNGEDYPGVAYRRRKPSGALPSAGTEGVNLQVDGVVYQVQQSDTLGAGTEWVTTNEAGPTVMAAGVPDDDDGKTMRVRVRTVEPLAPGPSSKRFLRVGLREP
jgi:hypothetical protein